jgi:hypothetical protein
MKIKNPASAGFFCGANAGTKVRARYTPYNAIYNRCKNSLFMIVVFLLTLCNIILPIILVNNYGDKYKMEKQNDLDAGEIVQSLILCVRSVMACKDMISSDDFRKMYENASKEDLEKIFDCAYEINVSKANEILKTLNPAPGDVCNFCKDARIIGLYGDYNRLAQCPFPKYKNLQNCRHLRRT